VSNAGRVSSFLLQVFVALDCFKAAPPAAEADLAPVQVLINEAYQGEQQQQQHVQGLGRPGWAGLGWRS
jgi:hypothetical protein